MLLFVARQNDASSAQQSFVQHHSIPQYALPNKTSTKSNDQRVSGSN